jgi:hypothetical protein
MVIVPAAEGVPSLRTCPRMQSPQQKYSLEVNILSTLIVKSIYTKTKKENRARQMGIVNPDDGQ